MNISWDRARAIFGSPPPPGEVWERQFDSFDDELRRLCRTPASEIDFSDLWCYYHDLAFVELQPEVFAYLFPVCLMAWHQSLMDNTGCGVGDAEFHNSILRGNVFQRMMTSGQRADVYQFFKDSFLARLDQERGFVYSGSKTPAYGWMSRFASLGMVMPGIDLLWKSWWALETPGRAVAAIEYISGLMYPLGQNPLFPPWTPEEGGGDPPLVAHDSHILDSGWMPENTDFLRTVLTPDFVIDGLRRAVKALQGQSEYKLASQLEQDLGHYLSIVQARVKELPVLLDTLHLGATWSLSA